MVPMPQKMFFQQFQEIPGLTMVIPFLLQSNPTRPQPDCRTAQGLDSKCCWLHWTCSCRQTCCSLPLPSLLHCTPLVPVQLCSALLSGAQTSKYFLYLISNFHSFLVTSLHPCRQHRSVCGLAQGNGPQQQCQSQMSSPQNLSTCTAAAFTGFVQLDPETHRGTGL